MAFRDTQDNKWEGAFASLLRTITAQQNESTKGIGLQTGQLQVCYEGSILRIGCCPFFKANIARLRWQLHHQRHLYVLIGSQHGCIVNHTLLQPLESQLCIEPFGRWGRFQIDWEVALIAQSYQRLYESCARAASLVFRVDCESMDV
jgi:hypothetical protein